MIQELARKIAVEKVTPVRAELDEKEEFPWEMMRILADAGLFGVSIEEEYGGFGGGSMANTLAVEELSRVDMGTSVELRGERTGRAPDHAFWK